MREPVSVAGLEVEACLYRLVVDEIIPGTGVDPEVFWAQLAAVVRDLGPKNRALLDRRDDLQKQLDAFYRTHKGKPLDPDAYRTFLRDIGYLVPEGEDFQVTTENVDPEVALVAGPQLVVPVDNARYALNAANARWGSLYDALYGTDVIPDDGGAGRMAGYNPVRGRRVVAYGADFLDRMAPLAAGSHKAVTQLAVVEANGEYRLQITLDDGRSTELVDPHQFVGYRQNGDSLSGVLLVHHGLHAEIVLDPQDPVGREHPAGIKDVVLEAALTTIQDCEDSVAAVDAEDKTRVYRHWTGLMKGTLEATFAKGNHSQTRRLNPDRSYTDRRGQPLSLPGRSVMLVRNVGQHMYTDAVTLDGEPIPEGFLDAMVTSLAAIHDLKGLGPHRNSRTGSVYIVKPKQHGPDEVAATVELFARVERALGLAPRTLKIGIMDEERRTTVNLKECIRQASDRVIFINTGFLDRTGDEIHTSLEAGPMVRKADMKQQPWINGYEDRNVDLGLA
ncbi:MAG: malate synthase G, partial [Candidatus Competibacterales bacterium]